MATRIHVIFRQMRQELLPSKNDDDNEIKIVPAEDLIFEVESDSILSSLTLDDRLLPLALNDKATRGYLIFDAFRSVGFHSLKCDGNIYWFGTEDAKLQLRGIRDILDMIGPDGLSWGAQLFFSDGTAIRNEKVDFAWLNRSGPIISRIAQEISDRPNRQSIVMPAKGITRTGRLILAKTIGLIRSNPQRYLEKHPRGIISIKNDQYFPRVAVVTRYERSYDTIGNKRVTKLLQGARELAWSVLQQPAIPNQARRSLIDLRARIDEALLRFPFSPLSTKQGRLPDKPSLLELTDERYRIGFELYNELVRELAWHPSTKISNRFAYVGYSDQIYQAYVAVLLAKGLGAKHTQSSLMPGLQSPAFISDNWDIYYDTIPPKTDFQNWRDESSRPAEMRPDITIINRISRRGILVDAKYQVMATNRLPPQALEDCQVYLQSFGRKTIAVCYPGTTLRLSEVSASGYTILEIPISPSPRIEQFVTEAVLPRLIELMC